MSLLARVMADELSDIDLDLIKELTQVNIELRTKLDELRAENSRLQSIAWQADKLINSLIRERTK